MDVSIFEPLGDNSQNGIQMHPTSNSNEKILGRQPISIYVPTTPGLKRPSPFVFRSVGFSVCCALVVGDPAQPVEKFVAVVGR